MLFGRGSCDAKGIAAAQVAAVETLRRQGITNVGLLFVVGEERGSDGAKTAQKLASGSKFLINGEPTDNRLGIGTRGALRFNLRAQGTRGAFVVSGAWRVGNRKAARRAHHAPQDRFARRSRPGPDALHGRAHQRRRRAERHSGRSRSGSHVPHGGRRSRPARVDDAA